MIYNILFASLFLSVLIIIVLIIIYRKEIKRVQKLSYEKVTLENLKKKEIKEYFKKEWSDEEKNLEDKLRIKRDGLGKEWQEKFQKHQSELSILNNEIKKYESILKEKEKRYEEVNQDLNLYREGRIKEINEAAAEYEQRKQLEVKQKLQQMEFQANSDFNNHVDSYTIQKAQMQSEIKEIKAELEVERSKRAAINEEIRRQREVEEQQDFYRIQLNSNDKDDVEILRNIAPRLRHPEAINKVIWTGYYQKPLAELRKRVAIEGSGIYKITRIKTGEIYIGKAVNVSTRWSDHCKTALGVGTLASSQLHRVMSQDGPEQFLFELLEEVPKDKLGERESYYIDFYDSKNYGLNTIRGEQNK